MLTFEGGQPFDDPDPTYVVTGGSYTQTASGTSNFGCTISGEGSYEITPAMIEKAAGKQITFHRAGATLTYTGFIFIKGVPFTFHNACPPRTLGYIPEFTEDSGGTFVLTDEAVPAQPTGLSGSSSVAHEDFSWQFSRQD